MTTPRAIVAEVRAWPAWARWLVGGAAALLLVVGAGKCYGDARADEAAKEARAAAHEEAAARYEARAAELQREWLGRLQALSDSFAMEREARWAAERERDAAQARAAAALTAASRLSPQVLAQTPPEVRRALDGLTASVRDLQGQLQATRADLQVANQRVAAALEVGDSLRVALATKDSAIVELQRANAELRDLKTPGCGLGCWAKRVVVAGGAVLAGYGAGRLASR